MNSTKFRVMWRTVHEEFIMELPGVDIPGLQTGKSAEDAVEELGHGQMNVQNHT
jgi:hypothetical protein